MTTSLIHPTAIVAAGAVGAGTRVWAYAHILSGASIGTECNIGDHVFVESGANVGNRVTIKNHVCVWDGLTIDDDVFIGPHAAFVNDTYPRSRRNPDVKARYANDETWLVKTEVEQGASIGANSTILGGLRLGSFCMIAAGSVVTRDVPSYALMVGSPARFAGYVCRCGRRLDQDSPRTVCTHR